MKKYAIFVCLLISVLAKDIKVFHLTDIHVEPDYRVNAPTLCEERPCCRVNSVPSNGTKAAPKYGDHNCDNAPDFISESFDYFAKLFKKNPDMKPDYILMTGDQCTHRKKSTQSAELNIKLVRHVFNTYREYFGDYHTIPVFGNHDTFPEGHMLLPPENRWMTEVMLDLWKGWVPEDQYDNVLYGGYYTKLIGEKWRVIGLNSLWEYTENTEMEHEVDPAEQQAFLEKWLEHSRQNGEIVWIIAHISAGSNVFEPFNHYYTDLMHKYSDVVAASFYGHTHKNHFYVVRDRDEKRTPLNVNFVTPAFEGIGDNDPAAIMFIIDEETKVVKDFTVYYADFDEMRTTGKLTWRERKSFKDHLQLADFSPATFVEWVESMWDDEEKFQDYMTWYHTTYYTRGECDHECKVKNLCDMLYIIKEDREACKAKHLYFVCEQTREFFRFGLLLPIVFFNVVNTSRTLTIISLFFA